MKLSTFCFQVGITAGLAALVTIPQRSSPLAAATEGTLETRLQKSFQNYYGVKDQKKNREPASMSFPRRPSKHFNMAQVEIVLNRKLSKDLKPMARRIAKELVKWSQIHRFDPAQVLAVIEIESSFKSGAVSNVGALGLMQIMPNTADYIARKFRIRFSNETELFDPLMNVRLGIAYLDYLRSKFGDSDHYLAAYNRGPTALLKLLDRSGMNAAEKDKYVRGVKEVYQNLHRDFES